MKKIDIAAIFHTLCSEENIQLTHDVIIETPKDKAFGNYATPLAFGLAKTLRKSPKHIAEDFCTLLNNNSTYNSNFLFTAVNGYINITLKDTYLWHMFTSYFNTPFTFAKDTDSILLEFVSANPTGPLHIGHGRWAVIGSVLANLFDVVNKNFKTEFYINDEGNQIKKFRDSIQAVQEGKPIPEDGYHGAYIKDLAQSKNDPLLTTIANQRQTLSLIHVEFDTWFSENTLHMQKDIVNVLKLLESSGVTYTENNAIWFKTSDFGDDKDRVLVKSDGTYTYFLVDIAYHNHKIKRGFNKLYTILGADHHGYVQRMNAAINALGKIHQKEISLIIVIGQLVNLFRDGEPVKMSKRTGDMITLQEVVEEIGIDATRYFLIEKSTDTHVDFDLALAKKKSNENPVYYIQYAHARLCTLIEKFPQSETHNQLHHINLEPAERHLLSHALKLQDDIEDAVQQLAPYKIAQYTYELARLFHSFYQACPILKATDDVQQSRIIICRCLKKQLAYCLNLLGISAPAKM